MISQEYYSEAILLWSNFNIMTIPIYIQYSPLRFNIDNFKVVLEKTNVTNMSLLELWRI